MNPEPQKSLLLPILLSVLGTAVVVGGGAYYVGLKLSQNQPTTITTATPLSTIIPAITPTASPTATPPAITASTANWKTYENENHGYSIKYPKDWIEAGASYKQGNDDVVLHSPSTVQSFNNPIVTEAISDFQILYYDSAQRLPDIANDNKISGAKSLLEYLKAQKAKPDLGVDYRSAKIGQYDGYSVDEPNIGNIQFYYLENKGHIYKFMLNDDRAELKQILTTFQFTK